MRVRQRQVLEQLHALLNDPTIAPEELAATAVTVLVQRLSAGAWSTYEQSGYAPQA